MNEFTSEVLPSGVRISATTNPDKFNLFFYDEVVPLSKQDINRMYGIAFPEKRRTGECYNTPSEDIINSQE